MNDKKLEAFCKDLMISKSKREQLLSKLQVDASKSIEPLLIRLKKWKQEFEENSKTFNSILQQNTIRLRTLDQSFNYLIEDIMPARPQDSEFDSISTSPGYILASAILKCKQSIDEKRLDELMAEMHECSKVLKENRMESQTQIQEVQEKSSEFNVLYESFNANISYANGLAGEILQKIQNYYEFEPIKEQPADTRALSQLIDNLDSNPSKVVAAYRYFITVTYADLKKSIYNASLAGDKLISLFVEYAIEKYANKPTSQYFVYPMWFFPKILVMNENRIEGLDFSKAATLTLNYSGADSVYLKFDKVFFVKKVDKGEWCLVVVDNKDRTILMLNTLNSEDPRLTNSEKEVKAITMKYIQRELLDKQAFKQPEDANEFISKYTTVSIEGPIELEKKYNATIIIKALHAFLNGAEPNFEKCTNQELDAFNQQFILSFLAKIGLNSNENLAVDF